MKQRLTELYGDTEHEISLGILTLLSVIDITDS